MKFQKCEELEEKGQIEKNLTFADSSVRFEFEI